MLMLIAIVGMSGSGKSETATYFKDKQGFGYLRFGDVVEEGVKAEGKLVNEDNEKEYRERIRKDLGMKALAVKIEPKIEELKKSNNKIVLDGLYSWEEYEYLKKRYRELIVICVYASPMIRYERLSKRPHRPLTTEEARSRDVAELVNLNKGGPIAIADFLVVNEGSLRDLHNNLNGVYQEIGRGNYWK